MTLRVAFVLLILIVLSISLTSRADLGPSVWEQLQRGDGQIVRARISRLEISPEGAVVDFVKADDQNNKSRIGLCRETGSSDGWLSAVNNQRIEALRQALSAGQTVELRISGPWNPCLASIVLAAPGAAPRKTKRN